MPARCLHAFVPRAIARAVAPAHFLAPALALLLLACLGLPKQAHALDARLGARLGPQFSRLNAPQDPQGEPTLMWGTAFSGAGLTLGLSAEATLWQRGRLAVGLDTGLLYSLGRGTGFAEHRTTLEKRTLTITGHSLRVPLLATLTNEGPTVDVRVMAGPEIVVGLASGTKLVEENINKVPQPIYTTSTTHVGLSMGLGTVWHVRQMHLPVDVRFVWDPFVANTTVERFEGYLNAYDPGRYRVAFNWQWYLTTGVLWDFTL